MRWLWVALGAVGAVLAAAVGVALWLRAQREPTPDGGPTTLHRETLRPSR